MIPTRLALLASTVVVAACASHSTSTPAGAPALQIAAAPAQTQPAAAVVSAAPPVMRPAMLVPVSIPPAPRTAPAETAVNLARSYLDNREAQPSAGADGQIVYRFGQSAPIVTCAPLHECVIQLQPGEKLADSGEPVHLSDQVRWLISPSVSGSGATRTISVVVKPTLPNIDADLVIATDRRTYYLRLHSDKSAYTPITTFSYPDDQQAQWQSLRTAAIQEHANTIATMPNVSIDSLHFSYQVSGDASFKPLRVFDDGAKTYIELPPSVQHDSAPALVVDGPSGTQIVNYRQRGTWLIVDKLFTKASLLLGVGGDQQRVDITRMGS